MDLKQAIVSIVSIVRGENNTRGEYNVNARWGFSIDMTMDGYCVPTYLTFHFNLLSVLGSESMGVGAR